MIYKSIISPNTQMLALMVVLGARMALIVFHKHNENKKDGLHKKCRSFLKRIR